MISGITDAMLQDGARSPAHLEALRTLQLHSYISVPLVANGRALGVMTFVTAESRRTYDSEDVLVAQAVAERAALAVDNARAYARSPGREPGEGRVPGDAVARAAHADQRDHGLGADAPARHRRSIEDGARRSTPSSATPRRRPA